MTFNPGDHVIIMERKSKQKDAQGHETWKVTKTEYLPVQWRLYWFRLENQKGKIDSKALTIDLEKGAAIFETFVEREDGGSARMHGSETQGDWKDYIEKAQTKSLGRALAAVGYGSQFTDDEFTEGERIVDSPVDRGKSLEEHHNGNRPVQTPPPPKQPNPIDQLKRKAVEAKFIVGSNPQELATMWKNRLRAVFQREVSDQDLYESEALQGTLRDAIERYVARQAAATSGK